MKKRYLDVMEKAISAYSQERIDDYIKEIEENGLPDHGFPRLSANLAILISHGRKKEMTDTMVRMMDLSLQLVPKSCDCDNDFSVRELCTALFALENAGILPSEKSAEWKRSLESFDPEKGYEILVWKKEPEWKCTNVVSFNCLSEFLRCKLCALDADGFLDRQLPRLLADFDENGMFVDKGAPAVYDLVTRINLSHMLLAGYRGKFYGEIRDKLKKAAHCSLKMQSVLGEIPYGGRSNQFLHNEGLTCALFETEAAFAHREGDREMAEKFKAAAKRSLSYIEKWINLDPVSHIKNRFPISELFGCEKYGYFNKYMITLNTWLSIPLLYGDHTIIPTEDWDGSPLCFETSPSFHRFFLKAGDYSLQGDTQGQERYDANGIGRIHKKGCPSPLVLSVPFSGNPRYRIQGENPRDLAIGVWKGNLWESAPETQVTVETCKTEAQSAESRLSVLLSDGSRISERITVTTNGITLSQQGGDGFFLPAIDFDGEEKGEVLWEKDGFTVLFRGFFARYRFLGKAEEEGLYQNRNGSYRVFRVMCDEVKITMGEKR